MLEIFSISTRMKLVFQSLLNFYLDNMKILIFKSSSEFKKRGTTVNIQFRPGC